MLLPALGFGWARPAAAQAAAKSFWFVGTNLIFAKAQNRGGETAVASDDPGLGRFLGKLGASLSYDPGQRYVIVTSGDRRTIVFTLGDARYTVAGVTQSAPFAPYQSGGSAYLSLTALAKALYVLPVEQGGATILQPQIGDLDVRTQNSVTTVTLRSALPVKFQRVSAAGDERLVVSLNAVGTSLEPQREVSGSAALHALSLQPGGSARNPTTTVAFEVSPGTAHALGASRSQNELVLAFSNKVALSGQPVPANGDYGSGGAAVAVRAPGDLSPSAPTNEYAPLPADVPGHEALPPPPLQAAAHVTSVDALPAGDALDVRVAVSGPVAYEWHRLSDNRWYVDLRNAVLDTPARDDQPRSTAVLSLRVKQISADADPVVRIALTLASPRHVDVEPAAGGFTVAVGENDDGEAQRVGAGRIASGAVIANALPIAPVTGSAGGPSDFWSKPTPAPPAPIARLAPGTNPRLIVIDPGHGGSDFGAEHNGLIEKDLTLDISKRLRTLLVARGWQVKMPRDTDVDVFAPNDSAHDELQARCDVANQAGARMFVSVHINSFTSASLNGTTTYYYKGADLALGEAIHRHLAANLKTIDRGVRKENFYVIHHTDMPAVLVETAFLSNPSDAAYLRSPAFLQQVALSIADGIGEYASNSPQVNVSPSDGL